MQQQLLLFQSVLTNLLESFSAPFDQIVSEYDMLVADKNNPEKDTNNIMTKIFDKFPRYVEGYSDIIQTLTELANCNPNDILRYCGKLLKDALVFSNSTPLSSIQTSNHNYEPSNKQHQIIFYYFSAFFLSDLIYEIIVSYKSFKSSELLIRVGFSLGNSKMLNPIIDRMIIDQWAVIFSIISEKFCQLIIDSFPSLTDPSVALQLFKYIRFDMNDRTINGFFIHVIGMLHKMHKKKLITSDIFDNLSNLMIVIPFNEEIYTKIFELAYNYRTDKDVCNGACILCLILIQKWPKRRPLLTHFAEKRIFFKAENKETLKHAIKGLRLYLYGNNINPKWYFWAWGTNPRADPIEYISWTSFNELGITDANYYNAIFVKYYFSKITYEMDWFEIDQLSGIILHLASLNFVGFVKNIVSRFLKLKDNDGRFIAFVKSLFHINSEDFLKYSISKVNKEIISKFNKIIHDYLIKVLLNYQFKNNIDSVVFDSRDLLATSQVNESDQIINRILEQWKITDFGPTNNTLNQTELLEEDVSLYPQLVRSLNNIFNEDDYKNIEILSTLIEMSFNHNRTTSSTAFTLCKAIASNSDVNSSIIDACISEMQKISTPEGFSVILTIFYYALSNADKESLSDQLIHNMEFVAFFCLCSAYPLIRHLSFHVLRKINSILNNKGLLFYIASNQESIELAVKSQILTHLCPKQQESSSEKILPINSEDCSTEAELYESSEDTTSIDSSINSNSNKDRQLSFNLHQFHRLADIAQSPENRESNWSKQSLIKFDVALLSYHYDIWLIFFQKILNTIIEINYEPLFVCINAERDRIIKYYTSSQVPSSTGAIMLCLSTQYYYPYLQKFQETKLIQCTDDRSESSDKREEVSSLIQYWLEDETGWLNQLAFSAISHIHFSLIPKIIDVLANVKDDLFSDSVHVLSLICVRQDIPNLFLTKQIKRLLRFISNAQYTITQLGLNGPRFVEWTAEKEASSAKFRNLIQDFCVVCDVTFSNFPKNAPESLWPIDQHQITSRFFINWLSTSSIVLEKVRLLSSRALVAIVKIGPIFTDSLLFDDSISNLFGKIDILGLDVLEPLLHFHFEQLLGNFIEAFFYEQYPISEHYLKAIIANITEQHSHYSSLLSGPLLFLALVSSQLENPFSHQLIEKFIKTVSRTNQVEHTETMIESIRSTQPPKVILPNYFKYATEAVFSMFFKIINKENLKIPVKDIVEAITPWLKYVRLLPLQTTIAPGVSNMFAFFTPYKFLENLMQVTESVHASQFSYIASIWTELLNNQDHANIIPTFIVGWGNQKTMRAMYSVLLHSRPVEMCKKAILRFSFAFYFHVTVCRKTEFQKELWMTQLVVPIFLNNWDIVKPRISHLTHFSFLFRDQIPHFFSMLCEKFDIEYPDPNLGIIDIDETLIRFVSIMKTYTEQSLFTWADEALKWTIGSPDLKYATISFYIYMKIASESTNIIKVDIQLVNSIIRTAQYHISHLNPIDEDLITLFVSETFDFIRQNYSIDSKLAFSYCSCFLDCRPFVSFSLVKALPVFRASLNNPDMISNVKTSLISIVRPTITKLETDPLCRKRYGEFVSKIKNDEMMVIIAPLKILNASYFPTLKSAEDILNKASLSSLCKALVHFSMMMTTASPNLLNCIFECAAFVVNKVIEENNRYPLARIYIQALRNLTKCSKAIDLIKVISVKQPNVVGMNVADVYEWQRSIEDVNRSLLRISKSDDSPIATITDVPNYQSVTHFLNSETIPKILPYESNKELLENMQKVTKPNTSRRAFALPKIQTKVPLSRAIIETTPQATSFVGNNSADGNWSAIQHPEKLILGSNEFLITRVKPNAVSFKDFLDETKRSISISFPQIRRFSADESSV